MTEFTLAKISFVAATIVLPAAYLARCVLIYRRRAWWFEYVANFCFFGAVGGWLLFAAAWFADAKGGMGAALLFSVIVSPIACAISGVLLDQHGKKKPNQALEPTAMSVTSRAAHEPRQP